MKRNHFKSPASRIATALVMLLVCCLSIQAQRVVRIHPTLGGYSDYESIVPHDYRSFSTTVDKMMKAIPNKENANYCSVFNFGDDEIMNTEADRMLTHHIDEGDMSYWYSPSNYESFLNGSNTGNLYLKAWYYINLANIGLAHLSELTDCTPQQKDEIEGDLYFMRAWWHLELMTYFGTMPYIDYELPYDDITKHTCLTAKECAEKCAADFERAAEKLPLVGTRRNYDSSVKVNASEAPNRVAALAYKGKVLLWAASPLNNLGAQTGALANGNTYRYDNDLAKKAAGALGTALTVARSTESPYKLVGQDGNAIQNTLFHEQNFEGITSHPFRSLISGTEQYDADGLWIHNETERATNADLRYIVAQCPSTPETSYSYILRVTIKGSCAGSLDANLINYRTKPTADQAVCRVPFTEEWTTVECKLDNDNINGLYIIFCSGKTVGDIHIKNVQLLQGPLKPKDIYENVFYTLLQDWEHPGANEALFSSSNLSTNASNWNFAKTWGPKLEGLVAHDNVIHQPTANYINHAYGMANGMPISDPESGFDPQHPFKDRDPRFYNDIVYDGYKYVENKEWLNDSQKDYIYMNLYTGGNVRDDYQGSRTGYFCKKLVPTGCNEGDRYYDWNYSLQCGLPYMRLADVYLMYAEACAAYGSASTSNGCPLTAEDAINVLRDRAGAGHVAQKYTTDNKKFMDEVRRERACELAFEGHRWSDLSRWLLLTEEPYTKKTSQEFQRVGSGSNAEPYNNEVKDWSESVILTRQFDETYYTFPLMPNTPEEIDIIYSEDGKTLVYYPKRNTNDTFVVPETVEHIGENCFNGCYNLKNIVLHEGIKDFGAYAFCGTGITEILLPSHFTSLPEGCFAGTDLKRFITNTRSADGTDFVIPSQIKSLGDNCFSGCQFKSVTIGSSLKSLGNGCFSYCRNLENVTIENGVESLGDYCFAYNDKLKELNIPASVNHIGKGVVLQPSSRASYFAIISGELERINVDPANSCYTSVDGVLYDKPLKHLMQCPNLYKGELNIPEGVESIDQDAVYSSPYLTKVTMPSSIKSIYFSNFDRCLNLTDIVIKATDVPDWNLNVSNYFTSGYTFHVPAESLSKYQEYKKSNGGTAIIQVLPIGGENTYSPNDLVMIGFSGYSFSLNNEELKSHVKEIYVDGVKRELNDVSSIYNPSEVVLRMDDQFTDFTYSMTGLATKVILPNTVKKLASSWMEDPKQTSQIVLPESLEEMDTQSLYGFYGFTVSIPKNVKTIAEGAIMKSRLGEIKVDPENMYFTSVDGVLFDKDMKTLIAYPAIKPEMDYTVPATVEHISAWAMSDPTWYGNTAIFAHNTLTLPVSLKSIGESAFEAFLPERVVCYAKDVPECGDNILGRPNNGYYETPLYVPAASVDAYKADPQWSKFANIYPLETITTIEPTIADTQSAKVVSIYGIDGIKSTHMRKGINILRMSDGTTKTVLCK